MTHSGIYRIPYISMLFTEKESLNTTSKLSFLIIRQKNYLGWTRRKPKVEVRL